MPFLGRIDDVEQPAADGEPGTAAERELGPHAVTDVVRRPLQPLACPEHAEGVHRDASVAEAAPERRTDEDR